MARSSENVAHVLCELVHEAQLHLPIYFLPSLLESFGRAHTHRLLFVGKKGKLSFLLFLLLITFPDCCLFRTSFYTLSELFIRLVNIYHLCGVRVSPYLLQTFDLQCVILIQVLHPMLF